MVSINSQALLNLENYRFLYFSSRTDEKTKDTKITASSETILHGLKKFTNYSMEVLATTNGGDGVRSTPIHCQTEQDGKIKDDYIIMIILNTT